MKSLAIPIFVLSLACDSPKPPPPPTVQAPVPAPQAPGPVGPMANMGPTPPGSYVNHVGNPAVGSWGPDGQWKFHNPEGPEANDTWKYLAAAGAGAAGGAAISYMLSKRHFEQKNPGGTWVRAANVNDVNSYRDKNGVPISREEYERRRAQSERDKAAHRARLEAQRQQAAKPTPYRDKHGKFITKEEHERRQRQSTRDKARARGQRSTSRRRR